MIVKVALFAAAREAVAQSEVGVDLPDSATVLDLKNALEDQFPKLSGIVPRSAVSVDQEYAGDEIQISCKSEIALIPPVSGG